MQALDAVVAIGDAPVKGNPNAKLTLIEFSDYQCPFCRRHAENTLPSLDKEYIATGKVRYVFHDFPLEAIHPQAFKAAEAAHCAGEQQKYWEMHGRLFANQ
jgi:protein-disulfide isomerase